MTGDQCEGAVGLLATRADGYKAEPELQLVGGPQPFWHQGPVSWKTVFPQKAAGGWFKQ